MKKDSQTSASEGIGTAAAATRDSRGARTTSSSLSAEVESPRATRGAGAAPSDVSTPVGTVAIDGELATLVFTRRFAHAPELVWDALTDPAQLRKWFMTEAKIEGRRGGFIEMVSGPAQLHWTGRILVWEPPRIYEYEWNIEARAELPQGERSIVRWELTPSSAGTTVVLTHRRLTKRTARGFAPGTHALLDRLDAHLAQAPLPNWVERYDEVKAAYPAWDGGG